MAIVTKKRGRDPRLRWFAEARFGMFIHFGLYALLERGEWVQYRESIPRADYEPLMHRFNPRRFDADAWVDLARDAGARYIALTAKHHDGFCLFDSALTDYKITNTPFGRDLVGELVTACRRRGMRIVLYYSQPDWHHRAYVHRPGAFKDIQTPLPDQRPDWPAFQRYVEGQVRELVTRYGRIDGIWFDGTHRSESDWRGRRLYRLIKKHQPGAVVNDRARWGDFYTPERSLPDDLTGYLSEACESVTAWGWGYTRDAACHSVPHLVESLVRMAAAGGNYLLNVGPKADGTIPRAQADRMRAIGGWLRTSGEAVYGTEACKIQTESDGVVATRRGRDLYLHLLRWPTTSRLRLPGVRSMPREARMLEGGRHLAAQMTAKGLEVTGLPASPADALVKVVRLRFAAEPRLRLRRPPRQAAPTVVLGKRGVARLTAADATQRGRSVKGGTLKRRPVGGTEGGEACVTDWAAPEQSVVWKVEAERRCRVRVRAILACPAPYEGSTFTVRAAEQAVDGAVKATKSFDDFRRHDLGTIALPKGASTVTLKATHLAYGYLFADVKGLELRPVAGTKSQSART